MGAALKCGPSATTIIYLDARFLLASPYQDLRGLIEINDEANWKFNLAEQGETGRGSIPRERSPDGRYFWMALIHGDSLRHCSRVARIYISRCSYNAGVLNRRRTQGGERDYELRATAIRDATRDAIRAPLSRPACSLSILVWVRDGITTREIALTDSHRSSRPNERPDVVQVSSDWIGSPETRKHGAFPRSATLRARDVTRW